MAVSGRKKIFLFLVVLLAPISSTILYAQTVKSRSGATYLQKLTGDDSYGDRDKWEDFYRKHKGYASGREPEKFLVENLNTLYVGRVLDLVMGEGRNAVFLAKKGYDVEGVDISEQAIRKAKRLAYENGVRIRTIRADIKKYPIKADTYDVVLDFFFYDKALLLSIKKSLKKGGFLVFENNATPEEIAELRSFFSKGFEIIKFQVSPEATGVLAKKL